MVCPVAAPVNGLAAPSAPLHLAITCSAARTGRHCRCRGGHQHPWLQLCHPLQRNTDRRAQHLRCCSGVGSYFFKRAAGCLASRLTLATPHRLTGRELVQSKGRIRMPGSIYFELVEQGSLEQRLSDKARAEVRSLVAVLGRLRSFHISARA